MFPGEYKFFDEKDGVPYFSTQEFHNDRESAPHIEQHGMQRDRLVAAADYVKKHVKNLNIKTVTDICCGDGGLLDYLSDFFDEHDVKAWGYDFQPSNVEHAQKVRGVDVRFADVVEDELELGELVILTECLEHFYKPHEFLQKLAKRGVQVIVASSPDGEVPEAHYELHTWGWSQPAYENLFKQADYHVIEKSTSTIFQIQVGLLI